MSNENMNDHLLTPQSILPSTDVARMLENIAEKQALGLLDESPEAPEPTTTGKATKPKKAKKEKEPTLVEKMNAKHAVVRNGGKVCVMNFEISPETGYPTVTFSSMSDFKAYYQNDYYVKADEDGMKTKVFCAEKWLGDRKRQTYVGLVFAPGKPPKIDGRNPDEKIYNLFQGFAVKGKKGSCELFWAHIRKVVCRGNEELYRFVRKWMAHAIQKPGEMPETALVLRGKQGIGKGKFVDWFGKLFGAYYVPVQKQEHLTGRFNSHQSQALLLFADEVVWGGQKEMEGALKAMISEKMQTIEHKGYDVIQCRNFKRLIFASNEDWCVPVGMDDRRFVFLDIPADYQGKTAYFATIDQEMENGGLEALMFDLETEDLKDFHPNQKPAVASIGQFEQKLHNMKPTEAFWFEYLCKFDEESEDNGWRDTVGKDAFYAEYLQWCASRGIAHPDKKKETFAIKLARLVTLEKKRLSAFEVPSPDAQLPKNARAHAWTFPSLKECRAQFEKHVKEGPHIWE